MTEHKPIIDVPDDLSLRQDKRALFFDHQTGAFFRAIDWAAFWTVWVLAFLLYIYTAAPSVTLEDSGELTVAADNMGVPHPPGYPTWTLIAWFFQWIFHAIRFHGYPNPAYAVIVMSATMASLASAMVAILVSRSGADIMRGMKRATEVLGYRTESIICWAAGVAAGLLLAVSPVLWSQAVIVEVYALNIFFMTLVLLLTYRWLSRPGEDNTLYVAAYMFGLGLTNHHTLLFVALALYVAMAFRDKPLFRDMSAVLALLVSGFLLYSAEGNTWRLLFGIVLMLVPVALFLYHRVLFTEWKRILLGGGLIALGLSFYLYMPLASDQNPVHNWGNTRSMEGFKHAITRGQYERITPSDVFGDPGKFVAQVKAYFRYLNNIFTTPMLLFALLPFFFFHKVHSRARAWMIVLLTAFFSMSIMLTLFLNPTLDIQTLFIQRRFFIPSHMMLCVWLGYAIIFTLSAIEIRLPRGFTRYLGLLLALILPLALLYRNFYSEKQIQMIGGAEMRGHDFGWQFGHWSMRGVNAIREDLQRKYGDRFEEEWAKYPNPDYPPEISTNAIFFGGTDPGRFVPTYMIFSAKCREDVYLITQNALADNTYMGVMRDLYGDRIWIPSQNDSNQAFHQYVQQVQSGQIPPGAEVSMEGGRVSVQGVAGVMMINGILTKMIFDQNKHKHPFYVEESYVIPWMYPYLQPHGLILKLHPEPIEVTPEMVANDRAFWDWYCEYLLSQERFLRDVVARKSFSKLRSAIAGIYAYRGMREEAEHAFRQSVDLYPLSPEACFRLADLLMGLRRFEEAREVMQGLLDGDPFNDRAQDFFDQIVETHDRDRRRRELEASATEGVLDVQVAMELMELYGHLRMFGQMEQLARNMISNEGIPLEMVVRIAQTMANFQRMNMVEFVLQRFVEREPGVPNMWVELTAVQAALGKQDQAMQTLTRGVQTLGDNVRNLARQDARLESLRARPDFRRLIPDAPAAQPPPPMRFPLTGM